MDEQRDDRVAVVVTGAAGFIGQALVTELVQRRTQVVAIDRRWLPPHPSVLSVTADLSSEDPRVAALLRSADAVFHLAGCAGVRDRAPDIAWRRQRDNVIATERVVAATPSDIPLVVSSSSSVYGGTRLRRASREDDPVHPIGGYAQSKVRAEMACRARAQAGGRVVIVRPFTVVGEGQRQDMALARWVTAARAGRPLRVFGSLERTRDFTDVREVVRGLLALVGSSAMDGWPDPVVNLGSGRPRTLREVVHAIGAVFGRLPAVTLEPAPEEEVSDTWADPARFSAMAGFIPHTDLRDVVARVAGPVAALTEAV